ncbi:MULTISPECIES: hypothetical protein [Spirulina sp. CCY15215]|uniref:hypothetical protein n=1 Tax=Spirulina sp. CCY15215 TaxID=2767591 RepID=UPI00194F3776
MLNLQLDRETESHLAEILAAEQTNSEELVKRLIYEHWLIVQSHPLKTRPAIVERRGEDSEEAKTIVERLGGHPEYLLQDAHQELSSRSTRKRLVAEYIVQKHDKIQSKNELKS